MSVLSVHGSEGHRAENQHSLIQLRRDGPEASICRSLAAPRHSCRKKQEGLPMLEP